MNGRPIIEATAIAGTLDLTAAILLAGRAGMGPLDVLQFVASGPLGDVALTHPAYGLAGFGVHFGIMAVMVAVYMTLAARVRGLTEHPLLAGVGYGLILWFVMYWLVRPTRWANLPPPTDPTAIAGQLFCHLLLVGIPIALVARRHRLDRLEVRAA